MLTSITGIGFVLAAGLAGELGKLDSLCAYAGIVPRSCQSGGLDSPAVQGHASPRCNRILKDWTVQSAQKILLYGPPELKDRITRWNANGQHCIFAAAQTTWNIIQRKWRTIPGGLDLIVDEASPSAFGAKSCWNSTASTSPSAHEPTSHQPAATNDMNR